MSPFMSSMPCAGLIEMPPVVEAHALADEGDRLGAALAAVPAHDHELRLHAPSPAPTPSSAPMPSFLIAGNVEHLDRDAELSQADARRANSPGKSTLAGSLMRSRAITTPSATPAARAHAFSAAAGLAHAKCTSTLVGPLLALLALGLVAIETCRRAAARRARASATCSGLNGPRRRIRRRSSPGWQRVGTFPMATPPSLTRSRSLRSRSLPVPTTTRRGTFEPGGCDDVERRSALAGEAVGGGGAARPDRLTGERAFGSRDRISGSPHRTQ